MYNNRSLFSDYYLKELVVEDSHWRALRAKASDHRERIGEVLKKAIPGINGDTPEAEVERRLIRPILDNLGHVYFVQPAVPSSEGVRRPDYAFFPSPEAQQGAESHKGELEFFKTALAVGDAKAWERSLDKRVKGPGDPFTNHNPSYQIDFYLRATERKWGLLTNGRHWRLYHRDLSYRLDVYYEVDLPHIISLDENGFLYFLSFFHKTAFESDATGECFLDRAYRASSDYAAKVSEELKDNVYEALRLLAEGLLVFPANGLTAQDLDLVRENAFIVIYRLLFIFYAEARDLLPVTNPTYVGTYSLRALTRDITTKEPFEANLHPTATSYWSRLQELFRLINNGDQFLQIEPYNGRLFDDQKEHQSLATWKIGDRYLAAATDQLARARAAGRTGRGFVGYRDLSIRELGSIYEGLLEHRPHYAQQDVVVVREDKSEKFVPQTELGNRRALKTYRAGCVYLETDKGERKATGSYYTPDYIVKYIVANTLGPLLEEAKKSDGNLIDAILGLKVLDPAMGSGHFLVEATDYLARALVESLGGDSREMEEDEIRWARREVVERCIYGVDLNPLAVDLAKLSLWLSTVSLDKPLNFLDHHLRCGNSLMGARLEDLGQLPVLGKKKAGKAAPASQGLLEYYFHQSVATAVDNYFRIAAISSDKLQDIQQKEELYGIARDILKRYREVAHIWTSVYFGNEVPPDGYMILQDKIRAPDPEWAELEKQPWFTDGVKTGEEERRFFHWELEFPEVFFDRNGQRLQNPGFSAVVGNPPYVGFHGFEDVKAALRELLVTCRGKFDIYVPFWEKGLQVVQANGVVAFICPSGFMKREHGQKLRQLLREHSVASMHDFEHMQVFEGAVNYTCIPTVTKAKDPVKQTKTLVSFGQDPRSPTFSAIAESLTSEVSGWRLPAKTPAQRDIFAGPHVLRLGEVASIIAEGVVTGKNDVFLLDSSVWTAGMESILRPALRGECVDRYEIRWGGTLLVYPYEAMGSRTIALDEAVLKTRAPGVYEYLLRSKAKLTGRPYFDQSGKRWYELWNQRDVNHQSGPKLIVQENSVHNEFVFDSGDYFYLDTCCGISVPQRTEISHFYLLALLNSGLLDLAFRTITVPKAGGHFIHKPMFLQQMPIRRINFTTPEAERERLVAEAKRLYYDGIKKAGLA